MITQTDKPLAISNETWSYILIFTGCVMTVISHYFGIANDLGAGIVGAGTMAFTNAVKSQHDTIATGANPVVINSTESDQKKGS